MSSSRCRRCYLFPSQQADTMRAILVFLVPLLQYCNALLEEHIVAFNYTPGAVSIHNARIVHSRDDPAGIHIAVDSLVSDWEAITGRLPDITQYPFNETQISSGSGSNGTAAIIVATHGSSLATELRRNNCLGSNSTMLDGKREAFTTLLGEKCLPEIDRALVLIGSDMRGAIYGIYTLAEQSGQSP